MPPSPIHHAAAMGRLAQVNAMLQEDPALLNAIHRGRDDATGDPSDWAGSTPLVLAARYNQAHVAAVLLHLPGVLLDARDTRGMGFLHWAAKRHYHAVLALALGRTEHEGPEEDTAASVSAATAASASTAVSASGFPLADVYRTPPPHVREASRRLLASKDKVGYTPLMHCVDMSGPVVWEGLEPTLRLLMRRAHLPYLEVQAQSAYRGDTAMHLVLGGRWPRMHALRQLLEMTGGDPRKRNYAGKSPLSLAVEKGEAFEPAVALLQAAVGETERTGLLARVRALLHSNANNAPAAASSSAALEMAMPSCIYPSSASASARAASRGLNRSSHMRSASSCWHSTTSTSARPASTSACAPLRLRRMRTGRARARRAREEEEDDDDEEEDSDGREEWYEVVDVPDTEAMAGTGPATTSAQGQGQGRRRRRASVGSEGDAEAGEEEGGDQSQPARIGAVRRARAQEQQEEEAAGGRAGGADAELLRAVAAFAVGGSVPTEGRGEGGGGEAPAGGAAGGVVGGGDDFYLPPELFRELLDYMAAPWDPLRARATYPPSPPPSTPTRRMLLVRRGGVGSCSGSSSTCSSDGGGGWFAERAGGRAKQRGGTKG